MDHHWTLFLEKLVRLSLPIDWLGVLGMIIIGFVYIINGAIQWFGKSVNISANNQYTFFNALIVGVFQGISAHLDYFGLFRALISAYRGYFGSLFGLIWSYLVS